MVPLAAKIGSKIYIFGMVLNGFSQISTCKFDTKALLKWAQINTAIILILDPLRELLFTALAYCISKSHSIGLKLSTYTQILDSGRYCKYQWLISIPVPSIEPQSMHTKWFAPHRKSYKNQFLYFNQFKSNPFKIYKCF